jgi:beta-glucosidase
VLGAPAAAATLLDRSKSDAYEVDDAVASVARDVARQAGKRPGLQALADHEVAAGNVRKAVDLLVQATR